MNQCTFAGRSGNDAEGRYTTSGQAVANFNLAVDRPKRNGEKQQPLWVKVTLWGKTAEGVAKFITKGKQLVVSGDVDLRSYQTRDGETRTDLTLNARQVTLMGGGEQRSDANEDGAGGDTEFPT